jgi:hypothetical protein
MVEASELRAGIINLEQQENSPYLPYIQLVLNRLDAFEATLLQHPDIDPEELRFALAGIIKLDTNKKQVKNIENSYTGFLSERLLEQKMITCGVSRDEYDADEKVQAKVVTTDLSENKKIKAQKMAVLDQFGMFIQDYLGPKYDVDGYKMCTMIATLRNDQDILLPVKHLTEDERRRLGIGKVEGLMRKGLLDPDYEEERARLKREREERKKAKEAKAKEETPAEE